jgi:hypothetical protein
MIECRPSAVRRLQRLGWIVLVLAGSAAGSPGAVLPQRGGELGAVATGDHVYVGQGATVVTLSSDGTAPPEILDVTAPLAGLVRGLAIHGDYLFVSWRTDDPFGGLSLLSIADPARPTWLADVPYSASSILDAGGLTLVGTTLYLVDGEIGLVPIDVSDPENPVVGTPFSTFGLRAVAPYDATHLLAWGRNFFGQLLVSVFDVATPSTPALVGSHTGANHFDVAIADGYMVLVGDGFEVVDLADPTAPDPIASESAAAGFTGAIVGDRLLLGWEGAIHVWDLSDPADPAELAPVPAPADRARLVGPSPASGELVLLTDTGRALTIDVTSPSTPSVEHVLDLPVGIDPTGLATAGAALLLSDFYSGLRTVDAGLESLGRLDPPSPLPAFEDVAVDGSLALLADWSFGLHAVDVSSPAAPVLLGSVPFGFATAVDLIGDRAWAVSSTEGGFFVSVDLTDPARPQITSSTQISKGSDVHVDGDHVYVADENAFGVGGLRIFDVTGATPLEVAHYTLCDSAGGVDVEAGIAALACHNGELHLIDVGAPAAPTQLGVYSDPGTFAQGAAALVEGTRAYFGHSGGVDVVDISDPTGPAMVDHVPLSGGVRALDHAGGGGAWVAVGRGGVALVRAGLFADGFESGDTSAWSTTVR